ncbi:MAG: twin-arginine translocase subunit TatC [Dehalococcoidia bacterium]|nr:twin-arginine translocase subunit TatC [Dehalococcoidia bacterium]
MTAVREPEPLPADEQELEGGSMTLLEHLLELRSRVMWCAVAVVLGMSVFFIPAVGFRAIEFLLEPALAQNPDFRAQAITPMENIVTYFRVALLGGLTLGMPMLIYQTLAFITPALTPTEKKWVLPVVAGASVSFVLGLLFGYFVVLRAAYGFLFAFGTEFADVTPTISSYMDLTTRLLLVLGVVFEVPIVVMGLARFGVVTAAKLWGWWRFAVVGAFAFSAVATPTPDPVTQALVAGPMAVLYFLGIGLAWFVRRR